MTNPIKCGCGGDAVADNFILDCGLRYRRMCAKCLQRTPLFTTEQEAIAAWNLAMGGQLLRQAWDALISLDVSLSVAAGSQRCSKERAKVDLAIAALNKRLGDASA